MAIDKSLRQHYAMGQRVGFRGGGADMGASSGPSGPTGGGGGRDFAPAPKPKPKAKGPVNIHEGFKIVKKTTPKAEGPINIHEGLKIVKKTTPKAESPINIHEDEKKIKFKVTGIEPPSILNPPPDTREDYRTELVPKQYKKFKQPNPNLEEGFHTTEVRDYFGENVNQKKAGTFGEEGGGFWSGIGKLLSWVAPILIPALIPAKLVPVYKTANTLNTLRKFANKVTDKDIMASLTTKFSTTKNKTKTKKSTTSSTISEDPFGNGKGNGHAKEKPPIKNVVQESVQEFSPQQTDMMKKHSQLQGVIESGSYQGKQLTAEQLQMLQQKSLSIQKLIEQYLVPVAHGGLIDSPLMGRSRDI